jgi:hypothetical protein
MADLLNNRFLNSKYKFLVLTGFLGAAATDAADSSGLDQDFKSGLPV